MAEVTQKREQTMRYSDEEISLIKNTFAENDYLLKVLRKFFLQGSLDLYEINVIRNFNIQDQSVKLLRKTLLPELEFDAPMFQLVDLYVNIDTKEHTMDRAYPLILARDLMCDYLEQQFAVLEDKKPAMRIIFKNLARAEGKDMERAFVELSARNTILSHIEFQLKSLSMLAGLKEETVEQTKARLADQAKKNSNK